MGASCCGASTSRRSDLEAARWASPATAQPVHQLEPRAASGDQIKAIEAAIDDIRRALRSLTASVDQVARGLDVNRHAIHEVLSARDRQDLAVAQFGSDVRRVVEAVEQYTRLGPPPPVPPRPARSDVF
jgi:methyl-accepting chemotaxis protein